MKETYESLAAIAVFKELYDQKKDIYDVLAQILYRIGLRCLQHQK